jgi:hypothetical protein
MSHTDSYVMLIACLPRSERLFLAKQPPISRLKLERRLQQLSPEHREVLRQVETALNWRDIELGASDAAVLERAERAIAALDSQSLRDVIRERLELRTCLAALRRRARGEGPPPASERWGFGRWLRRIEQCWGEAGLGIERVFPWIVQADQLLRQPDPEALERLILERYFRALHRHGQRHAFDLEAVVIYVLKWDIFDRWASANREGAARRFDALTEEGLGAYRAIDLVEVAP